MLKEIFEQPQTIQNVLSIQDEQLEQISLKFIKHPNSFLVGVGTTYYVSMVGSYLFSHYAKKYVPAVSSDEFTTLIPVTKDYHALFLSQSGETYDTRMALKYAKENNMSTSGIVNVVGSSISQIVDDCIFQASGPEISVVSTKAALSQMLILFRIALKIAVISKKISKKQEKDFMKELQKFVLHLENILNEQTGFIRHLSKQMSGIKNWIFLGKGIYYPIAMESALKLKEVSYLHAEAMPAGFLKHGALAMVDSSICSFFFLPGQQEKKLYESTLMAVEEVKARNGITMGFCATDDTNARKLFDFPIELASTLYRFYSVL